ncbi:nitroreductase family protein [Planktotalea sp.]|uniref:nitroreductase family protein n=1 Tax=Planktotalea sp. TaxID=2029877 RepID=UPI003D6A08FE
MFAREKLDYSALALPDRIEMRDEERLRAAQEHLAFMQKRHSVRDFAPTPVGQDVIDAAITAAGSAPSGANHQPWHFVAVSSAEVKHQIRLASEEEEKKFYSGGGSDEWIKALEPIGTDAHKPHLDIAPWLIVIFAQRWGEFEDGTRYKNYYVPESVGIATGFLISALHHAGLSCLTHTPNPMKFLNGLLGRPDSEKPVMILAVGHPAEDATVPKVAKIKKPLDEIRSVFD